MRPRGIRVTCSDGSWPTTSGRRRLSNKSYKGSVAARKAVYGPPGAVTPKSQKTARRFVDYSAEEVECTYWRNSTGKEGARCNEREVCGAKV